jgi:hypothetical protein
MGAAARKLFSASKQVIEEGIYLSEKKEGKRPGLSQNHFPGCVLEAIKRLDACGWKRLHRNAGGRKIHKAQ